MLEAISTHLLLCLWGTNPLGIRHIIFDLVIDVAKQGLLGKY